MTILTEPVLDKWSVLDSAWARAEINAAFLALDNAFATLVGSGGVKMEAVAVTGLNTLAPLSTPTTGVVMLLIVNGQIFTPVDATPQFSVSGQTIAWSGATYSIAPGSSVVAVYSI